MTKLEQIEAARQELLAKIQEITGGDGPMSVQVIFYGEPPELIEEAKLLDWKYQQGGTSRWYEDKGVTIFLKGTDE